MKRFLVFLALLALAAPAMAGGFAGGSNDRGGARHRDRRSSVLGYDGGFGGGYGSGFGGYGGERRCSTTVHVQNSRREPIAVAWEGSKRLLLPGEAVVIRFGAWRRAAVVIAIRPCESLAGGAAANCNPVPFVTMLVSTGASGQPEMALIDVGPGGLAIEGDVRIGVVYRNDPEE